MDEHKEISLTEGKLQADDKAKIIQIEKMMNYLRLKQLLAHHKEEKEGACGDR